MRDPVITAGGSTDASLQPLIVFAASAAAARAVR